jgi:histidine triad (HIT) family protein
VRKGFSPGFLLNFAPLSFSVTQTMPNDKFDPNCDFCNILRDPAGNHVVYENESSLAFLDHRPLFPGHCLVVPKRHLETIHDLPDSLLAPFFSTVKMLAAAVEQAMQAQGTFIAANNRISQSVPHFHVHVVPRKKGDGLKGFFWPRGKYKSPEEIAAVLSALRSAIAQAQLRP